MPSRFKNYKKTLHLVRRLSRYVKPYKLRFVGAVIFSILFGLSEVGMMVMLRHAFNQVFRDCTKEFIPLIVLVFLAIAVRAITHPAPTSSQPTVGLGILSTPSGSVKTRNMRAISSFGVNT